MTGSNLLTLLDDITTLLDDISVMGKLATKKTAEVLGDDLSLNAQQVTDVRVNHELPIVWDMAKDSSINRVILMPLALLVSVFIPWAITPLLMLGGTFLCFEEVEEVLHSLEAREYKEDPAQRQQRFQAPAECDPLTFERDRVKGAIRAGFILSVGTVAITLGTVAKASLLNQILILSGVTILVTIGVYGLVGVIVKLDDMGYWLAGKRVTLAQWPGKGLLVVAPWLMKALSIVGTLAMFLIGGGIVVHGIAPLHHATEHWNAGLGGILASLLPVIANLMLGFIIGVMVLTGVKVVSSLHWPMKQSGYTQRDGAASSTLKAHPTSTLAGASISSGLRNVLRDNDG